MSDIFDVLKEKYSEEVGLSFTFFEALAFLVYLIAIHALMCTGDGGVWGSILYKSVGDLLLSDEATLTKIRVLDFLCSGALTLLTISAYRKISRASYTFLASLKNMEDYVKKINSKYPVESMGGPAMRIYIANAANEQKNEHMKRITLVNGVGLLSLVLIISSLLGLATPNIADFAILGSGILLLCFMQWIVFAKYAAQVIPRLVLERLARNEKVQFGDEIQH
ncbi:hypothetical protein [Chrysiogenes arsenatis]|uniref:hypothetical protein n=1 Tax=Chrysiogenes arsenatis TaxID=309797 RepID=UPI0004849996|nr:hypothetical protein [Chrysiogenes arsenatis]